METWEYIRVDQHLSKGFARDGIAVLRGAWRPTLIQGLRAHASALRQRVEAQPLPGVRLWRSGLSLGREHPRTPEIVRDFGWGVNELTRPALFDPLLVNALGDPMVDDAIHALLEEPRAWGLKILWAPRVSHYDLHWHRDCDHRYDQLLQWKPQRNDHIQFNGALEPDDAFIVVPGSHRRPLAKHEAALIAENRVAQLPGAIRIALNPGDALFMDAHAIHRGTALPGAPRLTLHYSCQAQWVPLVPWERQEGGNDQVAQWHRSAEFRSQLSNRTQPYYERLLSAKLATDQLAWLEDAARNHGWNGNFERSWPAAPSYS